MMKKLCLFFMILFWGFAFAQVGINEPNPSATLDIKSKGNTNATKALEINNSSGLEMMTVLDNGNVGINVTNPTAKLHTKGSIRYENLPQISTGIMPIAIDANGYVGTYVPTVLYSYLTVSSSQSVSSFSLFSNSAYYSFPFTTAGILSNSLGSSVGTDASATITKSGGSTSMANNVVYVTIPTSGVYKINLNYYTNCTGSITGAAGGNNFLGIGTGIYTAFSGTTNYQELTTIRNNAYPLRDSSGNLISPGQYNYPFPHNVFSIVETTAANQKIALFINWGTADQFNTNVCSLSTPNGLDKRVNLVITKL